MDLIKRLNPVRNKGIAFKLAFYILSSSVLIFVLVFGYNYLFSRRIIERQIQDSARSLCLATVNRIDGVLSFVERVPTNIALILDERSYPESQIKGMLGTIIKNNAEVFGASVSFEPFQFRKDTKLFAPYCFRNEGGIKMTDLGKHYDYHTKDWYQIPKQLGRPVWSEPYFDEGGGNIVMATYSVPFYETVRDERRFLGVVTADISLAGLQEIVNSIKISETGYGFLISKNGTFVTHPTNELIMNETIFSVAESQENKRLRKIGRDMLKGRSGFVPFTSIVTGKAYWMVHMPLRTSGWILATLFPRDELMQDIWNLNRIVLVLGASGFLFLFVLIAVISNNITKPLRALDITTRDIAKGNLDFNVPKIKSRDEVGRLTESFIYMKGALKSYITELTETVKGKERMESEVKIAHDIQMSIVPRVFPPFPGKKEFSIYAMLEPARGVGGDFYNFFIVQDRFLYFVIGDVSGKGIPASLTMAVVNTLIKTTSRDIVNPAEVLNVVNKEIFNRESSTTVFVSIFCGILEIRTGKVFYSSGGHNPPILIPKTGDAKYFKNSENIVAGPLENEVYKREKMQLRPGDTIFLYTDGVTEAINNGREMFSEERLLETVVSYRGASVKELVESSYVAVKTFSKGKEQWDDITLLALRYLGDQPAMEIS